MKNISMAACVFFFFILASCGPSSRVSSTSETANTAKMASSNNNQNILTRKEREAGWALLFDGKTMNGWRTYQNKPAATWSVLNGTLYCKALSPEKGEARADLITVDQFDNFELALDWKISPKGNSGIIYLSTEEANASYLTGPEYQIIDDVGYPGKLTDKQKTGANYDMNTAPEAKANPVGEWNHTRIMVNNGLVEHWLNGKKIVSYQIGSDEWNTAKANSKWKDAPLYGQAKKGHIVLQDHGSEAWFRNIKLRKL